MRLLGVVLLALFVAVVLLAEGDLPPRGDPQAPANTHVSPYYLEHAIEEMETPNVVTATLADYRSYDTLGETVVIFTAGLASLLILTRGGHR